MIEICSTYWFIYYFLITKIITSTAHLSSRQLMEQTEHSSVDDVVLMILV